MSLHTSMLFIIQNLTLNVTKLTIYENIIAVLLQNNVIRYIMKVYILS